MDDREHQLAVLLSVLGVDAVAPALATLGEDRSKAIQRKLESFKEKPIDAVEIERVLDDFDRFFRFAMDASSADSFWSRFLNQEQDSAAAKQAESGLVNEEDENNPRIKLFRPTEDAIHDLNRLEPYQIVGALKNEQSKAIALVLDCLDQAKGATCMDLLPDDLQLQVFNHMLSGVTASEDLLNRVVRTTVEKGVVVEQEELSAPDPDEKMAGLLRELPRSSRGRMLDQLRETDEETAERIQTMLYLFEDLRKYDDRSIQKILGEVDKTLLVVSLQGVDKEISDKILSNLSKRAKEALEEEMEFQKKEPEESVKAAQDSITAIIAKLDQADQIQIED